VHDGGRPRVALIIPALDEEAAIGAVVRAVPADLVQDLVVVDNGSADRTAAAAQAAAGARHRRCQASRRKPSSECDGRAG